MGANGANSKTITASGLFSSALSTSTSFSFQIGGMISPPTIGSIMDPITISSVTNGYLLDTCSIQVTGLTANALSVSIGPVSTSPIVVNQNTSLKFSFGLTDTMNNGDAVVITFPSGSKFYSPSLTGLLSFGPGVISGLTTTFNLITAKNFSSGSTVTVSFSTYTAPSSIKGTQPFTISVTRDSTVKMTGTTSLQAAMSSLSFTVTPTSSVVDANTTYTFSISINDQLSSSGRIIITFPATVTQRWTASSCAQLSGSSVASTATCTLASSSLILTNLNSSGLNIPTQTLTVRVVGVGNPPSTQPSSTFNITTYYSSTDDTAVSTGSMGSVTATPAALNSSNVVITPSNYVVKNTNVDYTVSFLTTNPIPTGGTITLGVPYAIPVAITSVGTMCSGAITSPSGLSSVSCTGVNNITNSMYEITFTTLLLAQGVAAGANITLKVASVFTNPISTDPVGSFSITTASSSGYLIDRLTSGLTISMTIPADFSSVTITPTSKVNSAVTSYTFSLAQPSVFGSSSKL